LFSYSKTTLLSVNCWQLLPTNAKSGTISPLLNMEAINSYLNFTNKNSIYSLFAQNGVVHQKSVNQSSVLRQVISHSMANHAITSAKSCIHTP